MTLSFNKIIWLPLAVLIVLPAVSHAFDFTNFQTWNGSSPSIASSTNTSLNQYPYIPAPIQNSANSTLQYQGTVVPIGISTTGSAGSSATGNVNPSNMIDESDGPQSSVGAFNNATQVNITVNGNQIPSIESLLTLTPEASVGTGVGYGIGGGTTGGGGGYYYSTGVGNQTAVYVPTVTAAPLRPKTKSDNVKVLQWVLAVKGKYKGTIDGSYGPKTKQAVTDYQKASGTLKADGYAGIKTMTHMGIVIKM